LEKKKMGVPEFVLWEKSARKTSSQFKGASFMGSPEHDAKTTARRAWRTIKSTRF